MKANGRALFTALALALLGASPALAAGWHEGVKGGLNLCSIRGELGAIVKPNLRVTGAGGLYGQYDISPSFALQAEMLYTVKGWKSDGRLTDPAGNFIGIYSTVWSWSYLEVPVLMRVSLPLTGPVRPYAIAGPTFSFTVDGTIDPGAGLPKDSIRDRMKALDFGVAGGVGVELPAGLYRVGLEARYTTGLTDLYDVAGNLDTINSVFTFALAVGR